jgi:type III pantothenate kinase
MDKAMNHPFHWVLDVGNSRTKLAQFENGELQHVWWNESAEEHAKKVISGDLNWPESMLMAASGALSDFWQHWPQIWETHHPKPDRLINLKAGQDVGFPVVYETPESIGLDRLANAAGALAVDSECHWLLIDVGTCITIDALENGKWVGGSIAPGIDLRLRAMYAGTHALPYPENWMTRMDEGIPLQIGNDTESCLLAGAVGGVSSEINGRIEAFKKHWPHFRVALTGGDATFLELEHTSLIFADPNLTWKGYHQILQHVVHT